MSVRRNGAGVGVLDGVLYAVGGHCDQTISWDVETYRPSTGVWTYIPHMNCRRTNAGMTTWTTC